MRGAHVAQLGASSAHKVVGYLGYSGRASHVTGIAVRDPRGAINFCPLVTTRLARSNCQLFDFHHPIRNAAITRTAISDGEDAIEPLVFWGASLEERIGSEVIERRVNSPRLHEIKHLRH